MELVIADATPLILSAKLALLDLLCARFNIVVPVEVASEATRRKDLTDARYIQKLIDEKRIRIKKVNPRQASYLQKQWGLGKGESEMLALALKKRAVIVSDDFAAIRVAKALELRFTTTPMMIVELQRQDSISMELARAKLMELEKHAWISSKILNRVREILEGGT